MTIWVVADKYDKSSGRSVYGRVLGKNHVSDNDRPSYGGNWYASDEHHKWILENIGSYQLRWNHDGDNCWTIGIEDARKAMIYKLTWLNAR